MQVTLFSKSFIPKVDIVLSCDWSTVPLFVFLEWGDYKPLDFHAFFVLDQNNPFAEQKSNNPFGSPDRLVVLLSAQCSSTSSCCSWNGFLKKF